MFQGEQDGGAAGGAADLGVDVLDVTVSRLGGDDQALGDLRRGQPGCGQREHLGFTGGEPGGPGRRAVPGGVAGGRQHAFGRAAVHFSGGGHPAQFRGGRFRAHRRPVGAVLRHCLVAVGGAQDACCRAELV